jgi:hypothetical protein
VIHWPKRDIHVRPLHLSSGLDALSQADLPLELLSLCLRGGGHATFEDHVDLSHLLIVVRIGLAGFVPMGLLGHRCCEWLHLLAIQNFFALFQIVS